MLLPLPFQVQHKVQSALWRSEHKPLDALLPAGLDAKTTISGYVSPHIFVSLFLSCSVFPPYLIVFFFCSFFCLPSALHFFLSDVRGFHDVDYDLSAVSVFCDVMS
jgi:hypothetical protein